MRSYCLNSELYIIATALETQEQADNYCKHKFYPHWSVSHSSLAIFRSHVDMLYSFYVSLLYCVRYNEDFVKSRFCSIHFIAPSAGLKKIVRHTEDVVI